MKAGAEDYILKEEVKDNILPRSIINVFEKFHVRKQIESAEKQRVMIEKKSEALKELVVTVCHEFNNPLAAIKISTSILGRQNVASDEKELLREFNSNVSVVEKEIARLRDLHSEDKL
jgi:signal transduction histidine kinase